MRKINKIIVYRMNKIVICKIRPIKYLDNKSLIASNEPEKRFSVLSGIKVSTPCFKIRLSFIKKNEINYTPPGKKRFPDQ